MSNVIQQITGTIKNWWLFLLYGVLFIVFAIWIFMTPLESYVGLAFAFSILVFGNFGHQSKESKKLDPGRCPKN